MLQKVLIAITIILIVIVVALLGYFIYEDLRPLNIKSTDQVKINPDKTQLFVKSIIPSFVPSPQNKIHIKFTSKIPNPNELEISQVHQDGIESEIIFGCKVSNDKGITLNIYLDIEGYKAEFGDEAEKRLNSSMASCLANGLDAIGNGNADQYAKERGKITDYFSTVDNYFVDLR
ncbi:MAG: hypothetical protein ACEQSA_03700 [Weeksellaceae bacterium]